jgi:hypothetical protein
MYIYMLYSQNPKMAKAYGVDIETISPNMPIEDLAKMLPVIYVADVHMEYGTVGFQLNRTMNDISPELRYLFIYFTAMRIHLCVHLYTLAYDV